MSSFGQRWTKEDIDALHRKMDGKSIGEQAVIAAAAMRERRTRVLPLEALPIKVIPSKKKPLLNKTETLFKAELERRGHSIVLAQAITFKLADALSYRPDFVTVSQSPDKCGGPAVWLTAYETKGPHRFKREGINKLKMAATVYPWIKWVLVERDKGQWTEREIQ